MTLLLLTVAKPAFMLPRPDKSQPRLSRDIVVQHQKRAQNPLLLTAGFDKTDVWIPWLGHKRLSLVFG